MPQQPSEKALDDAALAYRAQRGCSASFEELLRRYQVGVLHFLRRRGLAADAEDVLQETFVRAHAQLARYSPQWPFAAWLFTIARRCSLNGCRRARPQTGHEGLESLPGSLPDPSERLAREEDRRSLWTIARRVLSEEQHTALWLHYVEGMPVAEIAGVLGRSRVGTKTVMFRARRRLLPHLEAFRPERLLQPCSETAGGRTALRPRGSFSEMEDG